MSRVTQDTTRRRHASDTGLSPSAARLSRRFASHAMLPRRGPTTPTVRRHTDGLGSSPVARHYWGNHCYFLFLEVLRCFSSLRLPPATKRDAGRRPAGCPIRKSADQGIFAPTRGLSQLITSFIASVSQGIHRTPLLTLSFSLSPRGGCVPSCDGTMPRGAMLILQLYRSSREIVINSQ